MELSENQRLYLQTIFDYFHEHGKWPTYKHVDRKLSQIRRDLDIAEISKSLPIGFATAFAFNHDLNAPAALNIFAIYECSGSEEDLADFVKAIYYGVERYYGAREGETTIVITSDELNEKLSLSELALRKVGLLIKDAPEYRIYDSFGNREEDGWWTWTLSREIRYFDGVTSITGYLAKIDQLRKPPAPSKTRPQIAGMSFRINDGGAIKSFSTSAAYEAYLFQEFVRELLEGVGFTDVIEAKKQDVGHDFHAIYAANSPAGILTQQEWVVEAKYGKPGRQTTLDALHQLAAYTKLMKADKALLVTNTSLTSVAREFITRLDEEVKNKLEVWDGEHLLLLQAQYPSLTQKYARIVANFSSGSSKSLTTRQQYLIEELAKCQPGQQDCHKYEDICVAILTEVFVPPLKKPQIQPRTLNGLERRDALFPLRGIKQGWEEVRQEFDANFLLCEFKNYTEPFSKEEVNQTRNYLRHTIGRLGIILSRKGASESAKRMSNSIYSQEQKVILFFEDRLLIELLKMKATNQNPLDLIQETIDQFYISHE